MHPAAAADQGSGIREEANELLWRRRVEHEDPIERLIGDRREDPHRAEARGLEPTGASGPPLRIGLDDHDMFRSDDFREERRRVAAAAPRDEDAHACLRLEQVDRGDETSGGRHRRWIRRDVNGERHVRVREEAQRLRKERFLTHVEERLVEVRTPQKAEPFQLGAKVRPGPHLRFSRYC